MSGLIHQTVLLQETVAAVLGRQAGIYVDATFGRGGHSRLLLRHLAPEARLLAFDKDPQAVAAGRELEQADRRFSIVHASFAELGVVLAERGWAGQVSGILADFGVSSPQLDDAERGFSFMQDGPLDMRMDTTRGSSAAEWIMQVKETELADVLKDFGEERFARRIARAVVSARAKAPIASTKALAEIVAAAHPAWEKHKHPATRSFQAIRIAINSELDDISVFLRQALAALMPGGRLAVISFHSLEDRLVKQFLQREARGDDFPKDLPVTAAMLNPTLKLVGKAVEPSAEEIAANPRARSAHLRVAEKLGSLRA